MECIKLFIISDPFHINLYQYYFNNIKNLLSSLILDTYSIGALIELAHAYTTKVEIN